MTHQEALDKLADDPHSWRYRQLVEDENPRVRAAWRERIVLLAGGKPEPAPEPEAKPPVYPSVATQAGNALKAAGRLIASGLATVDQAEQARRVAICHECEHFDATQGRCFLCGCVARWKARLASEHCPDNPPRW